MQSAALVHEVGHPPVEQRYGVQSSVACAPQVPAPVQEAGAR